MTRAFVLSGGASLGAVQVGMLLALAEAGIWPDLLIGTSVGAINATYIAGHPTPDSVTGLATVWRNLSRDAVFPTNPLLGLRGFLGKTDHLVSDTGIRNLVRSHLTFERLQDAPIPLHVVTTDATSGEEVVHSSGPALDAIVASASIPGVLPPVRINGRTYIDGGISNNAPISVAVDLGATEIWVLPSGHACAMGAHPRSALAMVLHSITLLVHGRLVSDIERYERTTDLRVVPPLCPLDVSPSDFSQADRLIQDALISTRAWIASGHFDGNATELLHPHAH